MPEYNIVQPGPPGDPGVLLTEMPEVAAPEITADDVKFVRHMIVHHGQALKMTELVPERSGRTDVPLFAERIQLSQEDEIGLMERWLADHKLAVLKLDEETGGHAGHAAGEVPDDMPGMITEEQLAELEQARGEEFDRLFLELMYGHHAGALQMVEELRAGEQSDDVVLWRLVQEIDADQRIEMDRINEMLAEMDGQSGR